MTATTSPERYRRRRRWPVLTVILVLLVGAGLIWFQALRPAAAQSNGCNQPGPAPTTASATSRSSRGATTSAGATTSSPARSSTATKPSTPKKTTGKTTPSKTTSSSSAASTSRSATSTTTVSTSMGEFTDKNTLASTRPADPSVVQLRVFNASQSRGLAKTVTEQLRTAGFESILPPTNDPLYPASDLRCVGEIRYGRAGAAAARTVLLVAPCSQLIVDDRFDDSVDLALGALYTYGELSDQTKADLAAIHDASRPPAVIEGQTASARPMPPIPPLPTAVCPA